MFMAFLCLKSVKTASRDRGTLKCGDKVSILFSYEPVDFPQLSRAKRPRFPCDFHTLPWQLQLKI